MGWCYEERSLMLVFAWKSTLDYSRWLWNLQYLTSKSENTPLNTHSHVLATSEFPQTQQTTGRILHKLWYLPLMVEGTLLCLYFPHCLCALWTVIIWLVHTESHCNLSFFFLWAIEYEIAIYCKYLPDFGYGLCLLCLHPEFLNALCFHCTMAICLSKCMW